MLATNLAALRPAATRPACTVTPGVPSFLRHGEHVELRLVERRPLQHRAAAAVRVRRRGNTRRSRLRPMPGCFPERYKVEKYEFQKNFMAIL